MRVRTYAFTTAVLGILVGAGGCTSGDSPTSPLAPSDAAAVKGGYAGSGSKTDNTTDATATGGGYAGSGSRTDATVSGGGYAGSGSRVEPTATATGGYAGSGS